MQNEMLKLNGVAYRAVGELKPNPRNARTHSKRQIKAIAESVRTFGFTNPILVDENAIILAGHGRFAAAGILGLEQVPVITIGSLSEAQKRAYALADNALAARAGWDRETLALELGELSILLPEIDLTLEATGFEVAEIDGILADMEGDRAASRDDDFPSPAGEAISQSGDVWLLGRHRLICADARDSDVFDQLLGDEQVDLVFTDPPYNVPITGHVMGRGSVQHPEFAMGCGEMSEAQFAAFLRQVLGNAVSVSRDGALHFVCMDWRHMADLITACKPIYSELKNLCVWVKSNGGQGTLYRSQHELVALFKVGNGDHVNNVDLGRYGRSRSNVWRYAGVNTFKSERMAELSTHPTVKPVALVADAVKDVTKRGAIVLDLFGGSGTTLIACERTGRRARLVEIAPAYVDVTIRRFEILTKADAIHASTGSTFGEIAAERIAVRH